VDDQVVEVTGQRALEVDRYRDLLGRLIARPRCLLGAGSAQQRDDAEDGEISN
jgi:hypothetical protein